MTKLEYIDALATMHNARMDMAAARIAEANANPAMSKLLVEQAYEWLAMADNLLRLLDMVR